MYNSAESQPTVLVLEDLHAADESSLLLLQFLARQNPRSHLLIVGTYDDIAGRGKPGNERILTETARDLLVGEYWSGPADDYPDIVIHRLDGNGQDMWIDASRHSGVLRHPSWAPDGGAIVYSDESWLFRVGRDGTDRVKLTSLPNHRWFDTMPDWGPSPAD
jgi:hypothetical protein